MADSRISALTRLPEAAVSPTDLLPIADLSASETKAITAQDLLEGVVVNMTDHSIPVSKIDFAGSSGLTAASLSVSQGDVVLGRAFGPGPAEELHCSSAARQILGSDTFALMRTQMGLGTLAVRSGSWVDGSSFSGTSSGTNTGDQTITLSGAITGTGTGPIVTALAAGAVESASLSSGAVGTAALASKAVTATKIADQATVVVDAAAPSGNGAFIGQGGFSTDTGRAYTYTSLGWVPHAGVQSVALSETSTPLSITQSGTDDLTVSVSLDDQSANRIWAGPTSGGAAKPTFRALVSADLPVATSSLAGAVKPGTGLSITSGELSVGPATSSAVGGVSVPGPDLQMSAGGALTHPASGVPAGSYVRVTTNATGHVVNGASQLQDADIANLSAAKLTSGTLSADRIAARSIVSSKLADYSFAYIQEATPPVIAGAQPIGMLWLQESTGAVSIWNGNSWMRTGASTLFNRNLRYGGTYNASTGLVTGVTQFGTTEGVTVGSAIPAASDAVAGLYFVASVAGSSQSIAGGVSFDPGDWLLCLGAAAGAGTGWIRIDTLNTGGGSGSGSGASNLDDLLDVLLTSPSEGDFLQFGGGGQWVNASVIDEGTWT